MNGLRSVVNKNRDELEHKIDELTHEVRTVTSTLVEFNSSTQINKRNHKLEIQRLGSQIEELRKRVNGMCQIRMNKLFASPHIPVRLLG